MDIKEIVFLTYTSIRERKIRNVLTILMIIMGCGLLVSLSSLSQGLVHFVEQYFKRILPNQIIVSNTDKIQESNVDNIRNKLEILFDSNVTLLEEIIPFNNDTINYLDNLEGVERINPAYQGVIILEYNNNSHITNVLASDLSKLTNIIPNLIIEANESEIANNNFIVIPQKISEKINLDQGKILDNLKDNQFDKEYQVTIKNIRDLTNFNNNNESQNNKFNVIDIFNSTGNPILDNSVFIHTANGKRIMEKSSDYDLLFLTYENVDKVEDIVKNIQSYFNNQVTILNSLEIVKTLTTVILGISTFISSIAIFSLIVGSIGIVITIYTSVVERTREIGIIKALGGTNRMILTMFLTESTFIGLIGTGIGIVFGFIGSYFLLNGFLYFLDIPLNIFPVFNFIEIIKISITVIGLSIIAGLYPAYKGSKISPVNALTEFS